MAEYHIGSLKYPPVFSNSRLHCDRKASLSGFSPDDFPFGVLTGKTKWTSGWANCAIWRQDGHCPQESPSRRSVQFRYWAWAIASGSAPTPSPPMKSWAWLIRPARYALNQFGGGFLLSCDLFKLHGFVV